MRLFLTVLMSVATLLVLPAAGHALAPAELSGGEGVDDNDTGPLACAASTDGLEGAIGSAVSPDGRDVYAIGRDDDAVVHLRRGGGGTPAPGRRVGGNGNRAHA